MSKPFLFWLKKIKKKRKLPYRFTPLHVISTVISINVRSLLFSIIDSNQQETKSQQKQKTDGPVLELRSRKNVRLSENAHDLISVHVFTKKGGNHVNYPSNIFANREKKIFENPLPFAAWDF